MSPGFDGFELRPALRDANGPRRLAFLTDGYRVQPPGRRGRRPRPRPPARRDRGGHGRAPARLPGAAAGPTGRAASSSSTIPTTRIPRALDAALRGLAGLPAARRVAVLGDMLELGPGRDRLPRGGRPRSRPRAGWDVLVAVGPLAARIAEAAPRRRAWTPAAIHRFADQRASGGGRSPESSAAGRPRPGQGLAGHADRDRRSTPLKTSFKED